MPSHAPNPTSSTPAAYHAALSVPIPEPRLRHSFRLVCDLEAVRSLGEGLHGDGGQCVFVSCLPSLGGPRSAR